MEQYELCQGMNIPFQKIVSALTKHSFLFNEEQCTSAPVLSGINLASDIYYDLP
jgi:hypothetical protein